MTPQLRPGLPGYTGPKSGIFAVIYPDKLFEYSYDVFERLDYTDKYKPENERKTRRENILYLGECPALAEYDKALAECNKPWAEYDKARAEYDKPWAEYDKARAECDKARAERNKAWATVDRAAVLNYIRQHIPDFPWDGKQLVFPT